MISDVLVNLLRGLRFRGKKRLLDLVVPASGMRDASIFGTTMQLDISDWVQRNIYLGTYEREETGWMLTHLGPAAFLSMSAPTRAIFRHWPNRE